MIHEFDANSAHVGLESMLKPRLDGTPAVPSARPATEWRLDPRNMGEITENRSGLLIESAWQTWSKPKIDIHR